MHNTNETRVPIATPSSSKDDDELIALLTTGPNALTPRTAQPQDLDAIGLQMAKDQRKATRTSEVEAFFGQRILRTDWNHPDLAVNKAKIEKCLAWQYGPRGLLLYGNSGGGKTRVMAALLMRLYGVQAIRTGLWNAQELFSEITKRQEFGRDCAGEFINTLAGMGLLLVDDFGQECTSKANNEITIQWFFRLLDMRYSRGLPLMITTNQRSDTLFESSRGSTYSPALRRMLEVSEPVFFKGKDSK
jgi:DNA replication protein DnaC